MAAASRVISGAASCEWLAALRLPVYIARGLVVIRRPSPGAAFGVGRPSARERLPLFEALRGAVRGGRFPAIVFACVAEICFRTDRCRRRILPLVEPSDRASVSGRRFGTSTP